MPVRGLLLAAVVLAGLGGAVYYANKKKPDDTKPAADAPPKILSIPEDQVRQLEIKKKDAEPTILARNAAGKWEITAPQKLAADSDAMGTVAGAFSSLTADRLIEDKATDLAGYGLASPSMEVTITKRDNKTEKLLLGDDTPTGSSVFAKLANDSRVFTVASYTKTTLDKTAKDLRDKRLLTFDSDKLTRVELRAKKQDLEFGKNNLNEWQILKPKPLRADGWQIEELIRKIKEAKMDTSVSGEDAKKAASSFSAGAQVATAKVADASGTQTLEVRKNKDDYFAKSSVVEGAYKVAKELGEGLDKSLDDFRNKKLFDFGFNEPTKIEVHDGPKSMVFQKSGDKWSSGPKQMDSTSVQALIDKLRDLSASKFSEQAFAAPIFDVTVTSKDGKAVEKLLISRQGSSHYAKRENEPSVYELDSKAFEDLQKAASDVKEVQPPKPEKKK